MVGSSQSTWQRLDSQALDLATIDFVQDSAGFSVETGVPRLYEGSTILTSKFTCTRPSAAGVGHTEIRR